MSKPKIIKSFESLPQELIDELMTQYPFGFDKKLVTFKNIKGEFISALPYETEEYYFMIKMTKNQAQDFYENELDDEEGDVDEEMDDVEIDLDQISDNDSELED